MHRNFASLFLFCATSFVLPLTASATPITVPTDLNPGDTYRLVFVTSTTRDTTSSNIADYNAFVTSVANGVAELAALGTTWSVIGSTQNVAARTNTGTNPNNATGNPIYRLDDVRVANDNADLWDGNLAQPLQTTESGILTLNREGIFTGTFQDGIQNSLYSFGTVSVIIGLAHNTNALWVAQTIEDSTIPHSLYAISGELTVVPEPSTLFLVCIGATAVAGWRLRSRRHRKRQ